jgi:hypothetical protein
MKSATLPAVRVTPELRSEVESLLHDGESLSQFVEASIRDSVERRRHQSEFIARGLQALAEARQSGGLLDAEQVMQRLQDRLDRARRQVAKRRP